MTKKISADGSISFYSSRVQGILVILVGMACLAFAWFAPTDSSLLVRLGTGAFGLLILAASWLLLKMPLARIHPEFIQIGWKKKIYFKDIEKIKPTSTNIGRKIDYLSIFFINPTSKNFFRNQYGDAAIALNTLSAKTRYQLMQEIERYFPIEQ